MIRPNCEKCHIKGRPTSGTVRPTSHNLQRRTKQFTPNSHKAVAEYCIQRLGLVPILQHFRGLGTCYMLTIIYIYFNFTK